MKTITVNLLTFEELSPEQQEKVCNKYYDINTDYEWWEYRYEIHGEKMEALGYHDIEFNFSGFSSQGDGASFTAKINLLAWLTVHKLKTKYQKAYDYADEYGENSIFEIVRIDHRYVHENTCRTDLIANEPHYFSNDISEKKSDEIMKQLNEIETLIEQERRQLCRDLYKDLEEEYYHLSSIDEIKDTLIANEYYFHPNTLELTNS